jgi:hypothetical protein
MSDTSLSVSPSMAMPFVDDLAVADGGDLLHRCRVAGARLVEHLFVQVDVEEQEGLPEGPHPVGQHRGDKDEERGDADGDGHQAEQAEPRLGRVATAGARVQHGQRPARGGGLCGGGMGGCVGHSYCSRYLRTT